MKKLKIFYYKFKVNKTEKDFQKNVWNYIPLIRLYKLNLIRYYKEKLDELRAS